MWEFRSDDPGTHVLLGLGADTLVAAQGRTERSTDGGYTWVEVHDGGSGTYGYGLIEASADTPYAGQLIAADQSVAVSDDRGATWETRGDLDDEQGIANTITPLASGRLVAAAFWGAAYSDDEGYTWQLSNFWGFNRKFGYGSARVEAPGTSAERVLLIGGDTTLPHIRTWYSDDGGETWAPPDGYPLVQMGSGVGGNTVALWGLDGARAVAVLGHGQIYATEDGGETWTLVGQVPDVAEDTFVKSSTVGPDGRLYVGLLKIGNQAGNSWVYRTVQRVTLPVAAESGPEPPTRLHLTVRPNPSVAPNEPVTALLTLEAPSQVEAVVYDALGRRVAVAHSGALGAGTHALRLDTAGLASGVYVVHVTAQAAGGAVGVAVRRFTLAR